MPQIDFESLVPVCGADRKIACEPEDLPDFPPESFWLSEDAEFDWFDQNAFLDRMESRKGNLNPSIISNNPCANNPSSQRFSTRLVSKSSIISLPIKSKGGHVDASKRRLKKNKTFIPKRNEPVVRSLVEPPSPMVSCLGRVRSKRGCRKKTEAAATPDLRPTGGKARKKGNHWIGLYHRIMRKFFPHRMIKSEPRAQPELPAISSSLPVVLGERPAVGLGGMTRFASRRRSAMSLITDVSHLKNSSFP